MAPESLRLSTILPATAKEVYETWLDADAHGELTGGAAAIDPQVGGLHSAWDGYIRGSIVELYPGERIVQTWRTTEFPPEADDSLLEVLLEDVPGGSSITIVHTNIPEGQSDRYDAGWRNYYFEPMKRYFTEHPGVARPPKAAPRSDAAPKKPAPVAKAASTKPVRAAKAAAKNAPAAKSKTKKPARAAKAGPKKRARAAKAGPKKPARAAKAGPKKPARAAKASANKKGKPVRTTTAPQKVGKSGAKKKAAVKTKAKRRPGRR